jgi:N-sulfoglucosamine sulfohydrolase
MRYSFITSLLLLFVLSTEAVAKKNVIILFPEDMSTHLSMLGTPGIKTPAIDSLARSGVYFSMALAGQPVCSPSKGALYTGRYPHDNGMVRNVRNYHVDKLPLPKDRDVSDERLPFIRADIPTLIEILKKNDVFTGITSKTHVQPMRKFPFDFGWGKIGGKAEQPSYWKGLIPAIKKEAKNRSFFVMANTPLTHAPYRRKMKANNISLNPKDRLSPPTTVDWRKIPIHPFLPDTERARKDLARYFAMVQLVDDWTDVILKSLEESGLSEETLVIFTPDHGMAYQRGKTACYPAGTHVPLIIRGPGVKKGVTIDTPVSHVDLMATILEFLDIDVPKGMHGRSLWPLLRGEKSSFEDRPTVMTETNTYYKARAVTDGRWYYVRNFTQPVHPQKKLRSAPWKNPPMNIDLWMPNHAHYDNQVYSETIRVAKEQPIPYELLGQIVEGRLPKEELFDLRDDPWATTNLARKPEAAEALKRMQKELQRWMTKTEDPCLKLKSKRRKP